MRIINTSGENALPLIHGLLDNLNIENVLFALGKPAIPTVYANPDIRLIFVEPNSCYRIIAVLDNAIKKVTLKEGDLLCCLPGACVKREESQQSMSVSVVFLKNCIRFSYRKAKDSDVVYLYNSRQALSPGGNLQLRSLLSFAHEKRPGELLASTAKILFQTLQNDLDRKLPGGGKAEQTYRQALYLMLNQFQSDISRESIASQLHITSSHLSRLFKQFGTDCFTETLSRIRLEHAVELIIESQLSLDEIAMQSGFKTSSYFFKVFKMFHRITPTQFRNRRFSVSSFNAKDTHWDGFEI